MTDLVPGINLRLHSEGDGTSSFVEIEDDHGRSIKVGTVTHGADGDWCIRITAADIDELPTHDRAAAREPRLLLGYTAPDHIQWMAFDRWVNLSCRGAACTLDGREKRFLIPALGEATEAIEWMKAHAHGGKVVEYAGEAGTDVTPPLTAAQRAEIDELTRRMLADDLANLVEEPEVER